MKRILIPIMTLAVISCSNNSGMIAPILSWDDFDLKGDVSSLKETLYFSKEEFGEIIPTEIYTANVAYFDERGRVIQMAEYNKSGDPTSISELEYRNDTLLTISNKEISRSVWSYGDESNLIEHLHGMEGNRYIWAAVSEDGNSNPYCYYEYEDNVLSQYSYEDDVLLEKTIFDETGKKTEEYFYYEGQEFVSTNTYENDFIKKRNYKDPWTESLFEYEYIKFDDKGNWVECIRTEDSWYRRVIHREIEYR